MSDFRERVRSAIDAGLSADEALRALTLTPAKVLGVDRIAGSIEPGKLADIVILDANPLDDIRNTRRISAVIQGGRIVDRDSIRREASARSARQRR